MEILRRDEAIPIPDRSTSKLSTGSRTSSRASSQRAARNPGPGIAYRRHDARRVGAAAGSDTTRSPGPRPERMSPAAVSRETEARFAELSALIEKWNRRINLVSRGSLAHLRERHIDDSAQLHALARHPVSHWVDMGSGGGFPGLVVAILALETGSPEAVTLIESDAEIRLPATAIRELGLVATVRTERIERAPPMAADVVSARALADLDTLLGFADRHMAATGEALFPKGASWEKEVKAARSKWQFDCRVDKSLTSSDSVILRVTGVSRA